jgi:4-diphosphocytidyl-2C-methyl-D-erythritol kinase
MSIADNTGSGGGRTKVVTLSQDAFDRAIAELKATKSEWMTTLKNYDNVATQLVNSRSENYIESTSSEKKATHDACQEEINELANFIQKLTEIYNSFSALDQSSQKSMSTSGSTKGMSPL